MMILNDAASLIFNGREPEVWLGGAPPVKVWPSRDVVDIALGVGFAARDQFRAALTARGLDYTTITEVPFEINLTGTGEATHLFRGCVALTTGPELDTRNVTNMNGMFQECGSLVTVPPLDTSNVVRAPSMFAYCRSLTSVPTMDAAKMIDVTYMFVGCVALTDGNVLLTNKNPNVTTTGMISGSGLTREPWGKAEVVQITLGTGNEARDQLRAALSARGLDYTTVKELPFDIKLVGTGTTQNMFYGCASLMSAPVMDTSSVTDMRYMFFNCSSLTDVPAMDTSQVTDMRSMFSVCSSLTDVPAMDTSQVTDMDSMLFNCSSLTHVPDLDTSSVTNMSTMFYNCTSLTDGNVRLIGKHPSVNTASMIANSALTRLPFYDAAGNPI